MPTVTFTIEPIHSGLLNFHGWRIVGSDGRVMLGFRTKAEAERLIKFFTEGAEVTR